VKKIFISYRRNDSAVFTGRLFDRLTEYYGADSIFLDIDSIASAVDFREEIKLHINKCGVFLVIIGKQWTGPLHVGRRIDNTEDHVRLEVEQALASQKPIIPIYCDDMAMLSATDLPESLRSLLNNNISVIDPGRDFNIHVKRLVGDINKIIFPSKMRFITHIAVRFTRRIKFMLGFLPIVAFLVLIYRVELGRFLLEQPAPKGFTGSKAGPCQIVQGLPDRAALLNETNLDKSIRETNQTFDIFALSGNAFSSRGEAIRAALKNNVKFRIVLLDHSESNYMNVESYFENSTISSNNAKFSINNTKSSANILQRLGNEASIAGKGNVEVRWWHGPFLNSFWVRDGYNAENAFAHMEISYYGDVSLNPSVRFGQLSEKMIPSLQKQFEYIWQKSLPAEPYKE
jgi:TIR domain